jgi:hypothetical protein
MADIWEKREDCVGERMEGCGVRSGGTNQVVWERIEVF